MSRGRVRLRVLARLWLAELRAHRGRATATAATLVLGTALLTAALVVGASMQASVRDGAGVEFAGPADGAGRTGADVVVRTASVAQGAAGVSGATSTGMGPDDVAALRRLPGVEAAGTLTQAVVAAQVGDRVRGITLESLADDASVRWQGLASGRAPVDGTEVAVTRRTLDELRIGEGDQLALARPGVGRARFTVVGVLDVRGSPRHGASAYGVVTPAVAQALARVDGPTTALLRARPGVDPMALVRQVNRDAPVGFPETAATLEEATLGANSERLTALGSVVSAFAAAGLLVAALVLATTTLVALASRRRTLALVRCLGASRAVTVGLVATEALALGLGGGILGTAAGVGVARAALPLVAAVPGLPEVDGGSFTVDAVAVLAPVGAALLLAAVAAAAPAVLVGRISPTEALRGPSPGHARAHRLATVLAPAAVAAGVAALLAGPGWAWPALGVLLVLGGAVGATAPLLRLAGQAGHRLAGRDLLQRLASRQVAHQPTRAAAEVVAVVVAVALVTGAWVGLSSMGETASARLSQERAPDLTVGVAAGSGLVTPAAQRTVARVDGVAAVVPVAYGRDVAVVGRGGDGRRVRLTVGTAGVGPTGLSAGFPRGAPVDRLRDDALYLPETDFPPYPAGARVRLEGPAGVARDLEVVYLDDLPVPSLVSRRTLDRAAAAVEPREAWVRLADGADRARVVDEVTGLAVLSGPLPVDGPAFLDVRLGHAVGTARTAATGLLALAVLVALIGAATTLGLSVTEQRREHATLRALGMERRRLRALLLRRVLVVTLTGSLVGVALGGGLAVLVVRRVAAGLDVDPVVAWPALPVLALVAVVVVVARLASLLPLERAAAVRPARALAEGPA
ncbi:ABC transporter permease [Conexibacter sp. SYSU D00693]|uniref:ABC transporter permease n=1 Tax=Conexibacter sp. SYSU D00693 TaxID=2812560 RepID=UPI00196A6B33|nr:ABC transporter permease [Conexibacter sp. SYSU D00693]